MKRIAFSAVALLSATIAGAGAACSNAIDANSPVNEAGSGDGSTLLPDGAVAKSCSLPAPKLSSDALAQNPAQCGQPAYSWLSGDWLGDVTTVGATTTSPGGASTILIAASGVTKTGPLLDVAVEQIAYATQDRGKRIDATALVAFPTEGAAQTSYDTLLVLHGTAGFTDSCAPSNDPSTAPLLAALASLGYIVVAPDYIGLRGLEGPTGFLHPYLVGEPTAIASLDAVRAAQKLIAARPEAACASGKFVTIGGSQGGHAALWVDRLAPYYAPELELDGVVATVPPADLIGETNRALTQQVPASENAAAFFAASSDWYGTRNTLSNALLPPLDTEAPDAMAATCDPSGLFDGLTLAQTFAAPLLAAAQSDGGVTAASDAPFGCLVSENGITTTSVARKTAAAAGYGILFVLGQSDTLVNPPIERAAFQTLCAQGMPLQYLECAGASHTKTSTWALPEIVDFTRDRLAGKKPDSAIACQVSAAVTCRGTPQ
ncbi:MAG: lipase family protein [Polyangiaceae bacterium]